MNDKKERRHRRTARHPESIRVMADARFKGDYSLSAAMGLLRCVHGGTFPCAQCVENRRCNTSAGFPISDEEFEERYSEQS